MGLLESLGLRRANMWEPPTTLDRLLASPIQFVMAYVYWLILVLRGPIVYPVAAAGAAARGGGGGAGAGAAAAAGIRVVCISDTHDQTVDVPDGDLLIHAGDLTNDGTAAAIQRQLDWLAALPHRHKVVVCGNHDSWFDPAARSPADREPGAARPHFASSSEPGGSFHYLERRSVALRFDGGRTLNVYGAPDIPKCGGSSFACVLVTLHFRFPAAS